MRCLAIILAAAGGLASGAQAQTQTEAEVETTALFVEIVAGNGCLMSEAQARLSLPEGGLEMDDAEPAIAALMSRGQATFKDGILRLTGDICRSTLVAGPELPVEERFLELVRDNGCHMNEDEAEATLPAQGINLEQAEDVIDVWVKAGLAEFDSDLLVLGEKLCAGAQGLPDGPVRALSEFEAELVFAIRRNGCRMNEQEADAQLPGLGLSVVDAFDTIDIWQREGLAEFGGEDVVLAAPLCNAHGIDADDAPGRRAAFIGVIEAHGCMMGEEEAGRILPDAGFDKDETRAIAGALISEGLATGMAGSLILKTENCS